MGQNDRSTPRFRLLIDLPCVARDVEHAEAIGQHALVSLHAGGFIQARVVKIEPVHDDPSVISRLADALEAAEYPAAAEDLRDGVPLETVESRIRHTFPDDELPDILAVIGQHVG